MGRHHPRPCAAARPGPPRTASTPWRRTRGSCASWTRSTPSCSVPGPPPLVPGPDQSATAPLRLGRLLLARVRHRRGAAPVLRRPRRARRRPPQGRHRPRPAAGRHRPDLPAGLLPSAADRRRLAAGALPRPSIPTPWRCTREEGARVEVDLAGSACVRAGVAGRRRARAALPARRRCRREPARGAAHHRPSLRRRRRAPAAPGDPPGHRRRPCPRGARRGHAGVPHQRGPRRIPRPRAHPPVRHPTTACPSPRPSRRSGRPTSSPRTRRYRPASTASPGSSSSKYFSGWAAGDRGHHRRSDGAGPPPEDPPDEKFNMAVMGLRLAGRSNAVAKLHGVVSRQMFGDLWPDVPADEVPIQSVTNGVHAATWISPEMDDLLARHVLPEWARGRARPLGSMSTTPATTRSGGSREQSRAAAGRASPAGGSRRWGCADGLHVDRRRLDRRGARPATP